jgi:DNA topoisomerase-3
LTIWKRIAGLTLTEEQVRRLLELGRLPRLEGFISKAGKPFGAGLRLDESGKVALDFAAESGILEEASPMPRPPLADAGSRDGLARPGAQSRRSTPARPAPVPSIRAQALICPKCGQGRIIEGRRGFGCNRYREGCDFVIWKTYGSHVLDESEIRALIEQGRVSLGEASGPGEEGTGGPVSLCLDDQWQVVVESAESPS